MSVDNVTLIDPGTPPLLHATVERRSVTAEQTRADVVQLKSMRLFITVRSTAIDHRFIVRQRQPFLYVHGYICSFQTITFVLSLSPPPKFLRVHHLLAVTSLTATVVSTWNARMNFVTLSSSSHESIIHLYCCPRSSLFIPTSLAGHRGRMNAT